MRIIKNIISMSLTASILSSSLTAYANGELCEKAFPAPSSTSVQLKKSLTVREHFKNLGMLKTDQEVEKLKPADKMLYLSMMDLEYSKAQEILKLFATFPILTSPQFKEMIHNLRIPTYENREKYLKSTRSVERNVITYNMTKILLQALGAHETMSFILTEDLDNLDSIEKVRKFASQKELVRSYGIPDTMTKEIAQFFNPMKEETSEFKVMQALLYRNFDDIVKTAMQSGSTVSIALDVSQVAGTTALTTVLSYLSFGGVDPSIISSMALDIFPWTLAGAMLGFIPSLVGVSPSSSDSWKDKFVISKWIGNAKRKRSEKLIRLELLQLAGLDPKSIQALPTVQQLKKLPKSEAKLVDMLLPATIDPDVIAYPSVDLARLENAIENRISLENLEKLEPSFEAIDEISENPFSILSYGMELAESQYLIIGRETTLGEKFKEIAERMNVWQEKRDTAKTEKDKTWIVEEKIRLLVVLNSQGKENASSWKYLASLEKAVLRFDNYLLETIKPKARSATSQVDLAHETFEITLEQIKSQIQSLKDRAKSLEILMTSLKRSL